MPGADPWSAAPVGRTLGTVPSDPPLEAVVSRTPSPRRGVVAAAAAVLLLAACGGDGGDSTGDAAQTAGGSGSPGAAESPGGSGSPGAAETGTAPGGQDFCAQAAGLDDRVEEALAGLGDDDPSVRDAFSQVAAELRAVEAPAPIASDWDALAGGLDRMADALGDLDVTDPGSLTALEDVEGELSTASANVETYLRDECGIGGSATPTG